MSMQHSTTGNLDDSDSASVNTESWKSISINTQSLDGFKWEIMCDERWVDPVKKTYECHRITRKAEAMGGYLYSVSTHIAPTSKSLAPSVSESLIFVPADSETT